MSPWKVRSRWAVALSPILVVALARPAHAASAAAKITTLADRYVAAFAAAFPEQVELAGLPNQRHDSLTDNSLAALAKWQRLEDELGASLATVDAEALVGRPEWITWGVLREELTASRRLRICRGELWSINPALGWQAVFPVVADSQPVGSPVARREALRRFAALPRFIDTEIANLREGIRRGYLVSKPTVRAVVEQLDAILKTPLAESPYGGPATRDDSAKFRSAWRALIAGSINPAITRYRDFLAKDYLPKARRTLAIAANPDGAGCYRALLRAGTGLELDPAAAFRDAQRWVGEDAQRMWQLAKRVYPRATALQHSDVVLLRALRHELERDPRNHFHDDAEIRALSLAAIERARRELPKWFVSVPKAGLVLEPFAEFEQASAPAGNYVPAAAAGNHPATYYFRTWQPAKMSRSGVEAVVFHETYPGHHVQIATASERGRGHPLLRLVPLTAFAEGWATYTEDLALDMGLYGSDLDRLGRFAISSDAPAVVDLGIQTMGWSREQSVEFLADHQPVAPRERIERAVDNYLSNPAYIVTYSIAGREFLRLREEARLALGTHFDVREFHERVLEDGPMPLWMLRTKLQRWIAAEKARSRASP